MRSFAQVSYSPWKNRNHDGSNYVTSGTPQQPTYRPIVVPPTPIIYHPSVAQVIDFEDESDESEAGPSGVPFVEAPEPPPAPEPSLPSPPPSTPEPPNDSSSTGEPPNSASPLEPVPEETSDDPALDNPPELPPSDPPISGDGNDDGEARVDDVKAEPPGESGGGDGEKVSNDAVPEPAQDLEGDDTSKPPEPIAEGTDQGVQKAVPPPESAPPASASYPEPVPAPPPANPALGPNPEPVYFSPDVKDPDAASIGKKDGKKKKGDKKKLKVEEAPARETAAEAIVGEATIDEAPTEEEQIQVLARSQIRHPHQTLEFSPHMTATAQNLITVREGADLQISDHNVLPYKVIRNLGMGGCASVEMVEDTTTGQLFAHKIFRRYHGPNLKKFRLEVRNEIKIMRRLSSHPHIIRLFATYACKRDFGMILTPVADGGDLATYLLNILDSGNPPTAENRAVLMRAFGCLANGLAFIHKQTIRHKDIKPQNILIHQGRIIYTDFGIAFDATQHDSTTTTGRPNAFTRRYCAPEVASWAKRNRKSDIFSLGCVFIEVLTVLEPLLHSEHLEAPAYYAIIDDLRNDLNHKGTISPHWSGLVRICVNMLEPDLDRRISADDLLTELNALERPMANFTLKYFCYLCSEGV